MHNTKFGSFDKHADIEFRQRSLPHWFQAGVAIFVTMRTIDSMPKKVVQAWHPGDVIHYSLF